MRRLSDADEELIRATLNALPDFSDPQARGILATILVLYTKRSLGDALRIARAVIDERQQLVGLLFCVTCGVN